MAKSIFNHRRRILGRQPAKIKTLYPGMFIHFRYKGKNLSDNNPLIMVLWNDYSEYKIHGVNLNYLQESKIKYMLQRVVKGAGVYSENRNIITEEDQDDGKYDDTLPYRNILREPYTRVKLPVFREIREGNPLSLAESKKQMNMLYQKVLKKLVIKDDVYRIYKYDKIKSPMVIRYDIEGLLR
jgi:hypothetical protein